MATLPTIWFSFSLYRKGSHAIQPMWKRTYLTNWIWLSEMCHFWTSVNLPRGDKHYAETACERAQKFCSWTWTTVTSQDRRQLRTNKDMCKDFQDYLVKFLNKRPVFNVVVDELSFHMILGYIFDRHVAFAWH